MLKNKKSLKEEEEEAGGGGWIPTLFFSAESDDQSIRKVLKALRESPKLQSDRFVTGLANANMFSEKKFSRVLPLNQAKTNLSLLFEIMTEDNPQKRSIEDLSFGSLNLTDFIVLAWGWFCFREYWFLRE